MGKATNEISYNGFFNEKYGEKLTKGKIYKDDVFNIQTSVDFEYKFENKLYLFEIDSYSFPKPVVGQYVILEKIITQKSNIVFVVINTSKRKGKEYKKGSFNYLSFVKEKLKFTIPFYYIDELEVRELILKYSIEDFFKHIESFKIK